MATLMTRLRQGKNVKNINDLNDYSLSKISSCNVSTEIHQDGKCVCVIDS